MLKMHLAKKEKTSINLMEIQASLIELMDISQRQTTKKSPLVYTRGANVCYHSLLLIFINFPLLVLGLGKIEKKVLKK